MAIVLSLFLASCCLAARAQYPDLDLQSLDQQLNRLSLVGQRLAYVHAYVCTCMNQRATCWTSDWLRIRCRFRRRPAFLWLNHFKNLWDRSPVSPFLHQTSFCCSVDEIDRGFSSESVIQVHHVTETIRNRAPAALLILNTASLDGKEVRSRTTQSLSWIQKQAKSCVPSAIDGRYLGLCLLTFHLATPMVTF